MELTRRRLFGLAGAGAAAALGGCTRAAEPLDVTASGFGSGGSGVVSLWCRAETQQGSQAMVDAFHAAQDRIRIDMTPIPGGQFVTKLATAIRGGRVPDVVDIDDINSMLFIYRDVFADLTALVEELPYSDMLSPGHLRLATKDDRVYGVPFLADNSVLWCNTELFERAGLDVESSTGSFEGILDAARAISALGDDVWGWSFPGNGAGALSFVTQPHIWAADTDLISGDVGDQRGNVSGNDAVRRTLEFGRTLWSEELVPPRSYSEDGALWSSDYVAGQLGMFPAGYGNVAPDASTELLEKSTIVLLCGPDGGRSFFAGGDNFSIPNGARNPSAAWEYIRFCLDLEQQSRLPDGFYTPVRSDVLTPGFAQRHPLLVPPLENIDVGYAPTTLAFNLIYNQSDGPWLEMFRRAVFDGEIEAAMDQAQSTYDRLLDQAER